MTPDAAARIRGHADRTGTNQGRARAMITAVQQGVELGEGGDAATHRGPDRQGEGDGYAVVPTAP